jgi:hypothetical protein
MTSYYYVFTDTANPWVQDLILKYSDSLIDNKYISTTLRSVIPITEELKNINISFKVYHRSILEFSYNCVTK